MFRKPKTLPGCTCRTCPACIAATATREAAPYTDAAWRGQHPLNPGPNRARAAA